MYRNLTLQVRRKESTQQGELVFISNLISPCATDKAVARSKGMKASADGSLSSLRAPPPLDDAEVVREYRLTIDLRIVSSFWYISPLSPASTCCKKEET